MFKFNFPKATFPLSIQLAAVLAIFAEPIKSYWKFYYPLLFYWRPLVFTTAAAILTPVFLLRFVLTQLLSDNAPLYVSFFGVHEVWRFYGLFTPGMFYVCMAILMVAFCLGYFWPSLTITDPETKQTRRVSPFTLKGHLVQGYPRRQLLVAICCYLGIMILLWSGIDWSHGPFYM